MWGLPEWKDKQESIYRFVLCSYTLWAGLSSHSALSRGNDGVGDYKLKVCHQLRGDILDRSQEARFVCLLWRLIPCESNFGSEYIMLWGYMVVFFIAYKPVLMLEMTDIGPYRVSTWLIFIWKYLCWNLRLQNKSMSLYFSAVTHNFC